MDMDMRGGDIGGEDEEGEITILSPTHPQTPPDVVRRNAVGVHAFFLSSTATLPGRR